MTDLTVSRTILEQLGGRRFLVMTGAKNLVGSDDTLSFKVPSNLTKNRISHVRITLTAMDDYTVEFIRIRGTKITTVETVTGVYCDNLQEVFTEHTGLLTSLFALAS